MPLNEAGVAEARGSRLTLVRHAPTVASRARRFAADEALDEAARQQARAARSAFEVADRFVCSPMARARETADCLGLAYTVDVRVTECDFGAWAGLTFDEVRARFGDDAIDAWLADPHAAPHGGESLADVATRVGEFMAEAHTLPGSTLVVTHGGVIRIAVVLARGEPLGRLWGMDIAPLSATSFRRRGSRWAIGADQGPANA